MSPFVTSLVATLALTAALTSQAADASEAHFSAGVFSGRYAQSSSNSSLVQSDKSPHAPLTGTAVSVGLSAASFDGDVDYASVKAKGASYFGQRTDLAVSAGMRFDTVRYVVPIFGLYRQAQTSDRADPTAPIAFVEKTQTLLLGLRVRGIPMRFGNVGVIVGAQADYLTNGSPLNDGTRLQATLGIAYDLNGVAPSLSLGWAQTSLHAGTRTDGIERDVHSTMTGMTLSLGLEL